MERKKLKTLATAAFGLALAFTPSYAMNLTPDSLENLGIDFSDLVPPSSNCNLACLQAEAAEQGVTIGGVSSVDDLYTINVTDSTFTVTWNGGQSAGCPECYLYVKDGNHAPYAYLFNIGTWNGTDQINGSQFWTGQGGISHVDLYATARVPEPTSLLLLGAGLVGIGIWRRWLVNV